MTLDLFLLVIEAIDEIYDGLTDFISSFYLFDLCNHFTIFLVIYLTVFLGKLRLAVLLTDKK